MVWYVMFHGQRSGVYKLWGVCSEYILGFSGAVYQSYSARMQAEEAFVAFLEHQTKIGRQNMLHESQNMSLTSGVGKVG
jgi:viroplasmin and RNaseH domain-containing protein